ncbi:MAG TPA: TSUP family transporter, partial [Longimicrobiales bacterium]|nr:TSUP family transporter [Longimicrobiales bacterium]
GNQGGVRSAALLRYQLSREGVVATATAIALLVDGVRIPVYVADASGALLDNWRVIAIAAIGVVVGTLIGARVLLRLPERWFRHAVALLLIGLGVFMLARALGA